MTRAYISTTEREGKVAVWLQVAEDQHPLNVCDLEKKEATENVLKAIAMGIEMGMDHNSKKTREFVNSIARNRVLVGDKNV